jgi:hypothetical protein
MTTLNYETPHCVKFSIILLLPASYFQIFSTREDDTPHGSQPPVGAEPSSVLGQVRLVGFEVLTAVSMKM